MGTLSVVVHRRAQLSIDEIANWYFHNVGYKATEHFLEDVQRTIRTLATFPQAGTVEHTIVPRKTQLYGFPVHPKYRIIYRFTNTTLYIITLRATMKKN